MTAADMAQTDASIYALAASGFRDTSPPAASDTTMMLDILMTNREMSPASARACARHLEELADLIDRQDEDALRATLQNAAIQRRRAFRP